MSQKGQLGNNNLLLTQRQRESRRVRSRQELYATKQELAEMLSVLQLEIVDLQQQHNCVVDEIKPGLAVSWGLWLNSWVEKIPVIGVVLGLPGRFLHGTLKTAYNAIASAKLKRYKIKQI